ncbi:MAG: choice-of-anchor T family protein, partial [Candidatus Thalassarchaeaceae archaeon]
MSRVSLVMIFLLFSVSLNSYIPTAEAQVEPEIILTCDDSTNMSVDPGSQKVAYISCEVENPTVHVITVQVTVQGGVLSTVAPNDFTINRGSSWTFSVTYGGNIDTRSGAHESRIDAVITKVNSVNYPGNPESYDVLINVNEYIDCQYELEHQLLVVNAGSPIVVSSKIDCYANNDFTKEFEILMIDRDSESESLPTGFEYEQKNCLIENSPDENIVSKKCKFEISTPIYLLRTLDSCIIIVEVGDENTDLCYESLSME